MLFCVGLRYKNLPKLHLKFAFVLWENFWTSKLHICIYCTVVWHLNMNYSSDFKWVSYFSRCGKITKRSILWLNFECGKHCPRVEIENNFKYESRKKYYCPLIIFRWNKYPSNSLHAIEPNIEYTKYNWAKRPPF